MTTQIRRDMMISRTNLGEKQKDLNFKVNNAIKNKINAEKLKLERHNNDIDVLFDIDLAAKNKNVDDIIKILKCGDGLYISRALKKCTWLGEQEFECFINPEHLDVSVFPYMSMKMKKKVLNTLATYLKNDDIIINFYKYCFKNKLVNEASKYLLITPEYFKLELLRNPDGINALEQFYKSSERNDYIKHFVKGSFTLAEHYLSAENFDKRKTLTDLAYLYSVSSEKYLDLIEIHNTSPNFGNRISKNILKTYKGRVFRRPALYIQSLTKPMFIKYTSIQDAKSYLRILMKSYKSSEFGQFYKLYKTTIDIIPKDERFSFIRKIFLESYPDESLDTGKEFYISRFYEMMSDSEKETWALNHIDSGDEILGSTEDYLWYQFVNFDKAFVEIKKIIIITTDKNKRIDILNVLIESSQTPEHIETLLNYFYDRHVNETPCKKEQFITALNAKHDFTKFNKSCWMALEKIFYSLNIYDNQHFYMYRDLKLTALYYYMINGHDMPDGLKKYMCENGASHISELKSLCKKEKDKQQLILDYLLQFYIQQLVSLDNKTGDEDNIEKLVNFVLTVLKVFLKTKDDIPDEVQKFIKQFPKFFEQHSLLAKPQLTQNDINRYLKTDARLLIYEFPKIKEYIERKFENINWIVRKLKIYFRSLSGLYLHLLEQCLSNDDLSLHLAKVTVHGIFVMADESFKIYILKKYLPVDAKIDHKNISKNKFHIQQAICGLVHHSRPPVPLQYYLPYIKGDYVFFCLPVFYSYLVNLPTPLCIEFVEAILNKPISIQKHGIRLAFQSFPVENLIKLIESVWEKTRNVSLRKTVYSAIFKKCVDDNSEKRACLFELLMKLTSRLNQDDDEEVFNFFTNNRLASALVPAYLKVAWTTVNNFPKRSINIKRACQILNQIENQVAIGVPDEIIDPIVAEFVYEMLEFQPPPVEPENLIQLKDVKLRLIQIYLVFVTNNEQLVKRVNIIKQIMNSIFTVWDKILNNKYVVKLFFFDFLNGLVKKAFYNNISIYQKQECFYFVTILFKETLQIILNLPEKEVYFYTLIWELRVNIITIQIITDVLKEKKQNSGDREMLMRPIIKLATGFADLVNKYISEGKYFGLFHENIRNIIFDSLTNLTYFLIDYWSEHTEHFGPVVNVTFCKELAKSDKREVLLFAANLVCKSCPENLNEDNYDILEKLNSTTDDEIRFYMFQRFGIDNGFICFNRKQNDTP